MTSPNPSRTVPQTRLRGRYKSLSKVVAESKRACDRLLIDVTPLRDEFLEAVGAWKADDLRSERFHAPNTRRVPKTRGTTIVTNLLKNGDICVSAPVPYTFRYIDREISPIRTPNGHFADGTTARTSGSGGIDHIGMIEGAPCIPVLGEIKYANDAEPFYAFIQLLTYLSELSSEAQLARASHFLFNDRISYPTSWDLHILLADFNDRGSRGRLIKDTIDLAAKFKTAMAPYREAALLGRISCLRMGTKPFDGSLALEWEA